MRSNLRLCLVLLLVWALNLQGFGSEVPFLYFPNTIPATAPVLALQQTANKEILFVNREAVYIFNSKQTSLVLNFSEHQISGTRQALFTAGGLVLLTDRGLLAVDLKKGRVDKLVEYQEQEAIEKVFYDKAHDRLYCTSGGSLFTKTGKNQLQKLDIRQKNIQSILFTPEENILVLEKSILFYNQQWALLERVQLKEALVDSYYANGRLLLLTATAVWSKEKGKTLKKLQDIENVQPACLLEDKTGKIWVGTHNSGLLLIDGHELAFFSTLHKYPFSNIGGIYESSDLSLWFYSQGMLAVKPFPFPEVADNSPPGIVLEEVFIQQKDSVKKVLWATTDSIHILMKEQEQLLINAFAIQFNPMNKSSIRYRVGNEEQQWKQPGSNDFILLAGLAPGRHILELAAETEAGIKSEERLRFTIHVEGDPWVRWWPMGTGSLGLMLIGFFAFKGFRSVNEGKSREAREKYERELMKMQKRSHEQMMKAEGLKQVNELISAQKLELEDKNKQILAQKYELSLTNDQIKKQKDLIEKTSDKLQSSINYAKRIQTALMGDEIQIKHDLPESFVFFKPRDQVSGDFFWFEKAQNEKGDKLLIIAAVDCTGHGVPGAIVSVVGIKLLNAIVNAKGITDPGQILTELNANLLKSLKYEQTRINDGMDMSICTINLKEKKLWFAGAKNPIFIVENGELEVIKGDKHPIGGQKLKAEEKTFHTHELDLDGEKGKMFYLFTDGYQDQFGGESKSKFLTKNFKNLLIEISNQSMMDQKYMLAKKIMEWQGDESQTDDILVLGFRL